MRNILIIAILACFTVFVIIVTIMEKLKAQNAAASNKKRSEIIDISDLAQSEEFSARVVGINKEGRQLAFSGLGNLGQEPQSQPIPRVTGAIFGQGFEVSKTERNFRSGNGAIFASVRCS